MHSEDDLLPLSGLQHLVFCERQWASDPHRAGLGGEPADGAGARAARAGARGRRGVAAGTAQWRAGCGCARCGWGFPGRPTSSSFAAAAEGGRAGWRGGLVAAVPCGIQAGAAEARPLRRSPVMRAGAVPGGDVRASSGGGRAVLRDAAAADWRCRSTRHCAGRPSGWRRACTSCTGRARLRGRCMLPKCDNCSLIALCMPRALAKPPGVARYLARALAAGDE